MFCKNCGFKMNDGDRYCSNCGYDNCTSNNNYQTINNDDIPNIGLNIISVLWPLVGLILYLCMRNSTPHKAKSCGKCALISFIVRVILTIILILLFVFIFSNFYSDGYLDDYINDGVYSVDDYDYDYDIEEFEYMVKYYATLASSEFYKEVYKDNTITSKCYNITDLEDNAYYDGSIEVSLENDEFKITIWLTNYEYYVSGIDYDNWSDDDIQIGDKIEKSCTIDSDDFSL